MATRLDQADYVKTALRLPPEMHEAVHAAAAKSGRSYNAELVARIERSFDEAAGFVTKQQFESTISKAVLSLEADQVVALSVRSMLANNVLRMFELIPKDRRTEDVTNAYEFARALKSPGGVGLEEAAAKIMQRSADEREPRDLANALRRQEHRLQQELAGDRAFTVADGQKTPPEQHRRIRIPPKKK